MAELQPDTTRHLILDRDGVLNEEPPDGGYVCDPDAFRWLPGVLEALARLRAAGVRLSVVTNQSCVGRGILTAEGLARVHARMSRDAAAAGGALDAIFCCPHAPDAGCACRKPAPGLVHAAIRESGIDPRATLLVGDADRDLAAGRSAGIAVALVRTGKGRATERTLSDPRPPVFDDLASVVAALAGGTP
jgi:D-glycero-D-manno-heptose 1,7-bisphosphate phosphatase